MIQGDFWQKIKNNYIAWREFNYHKPHIKYGLIIVVLLTLPIFYYLIFEVTSNQQHSLFVINRLDSHGVKSTTGPGDGKIRSVNIPEFVKGIYISAATAGHKKRFTELTELVEQTELNAMVIDIKDWRGALAFKTENEYLSPYVAKYPELGNLKEFTAPLREKNIYLIARVFVFQDPVFAEAHPEYAVAQSRGGLWRDYRGIPWLDPASKDVWKYNVAIAKEAFIGGFDEIQFDYIRFPSDGNISSAVYPVWDGKKKKHEVMADFFLYLDNHLRVKLGIPISVDLFGLTMWQHDYDLNIGQKLSDAVSRFDFISPMVYPSHYPAGFNGYANPATKPYEVVYHNLVRGQDLLNKMREQDTYDENVSLATYRPWIQDFHLGATYSATLVKAQMQATEDGGGTGWLLWNARNVYTAGALAPATE